jgi:regulator of sigma E protease
MSALVTLAAFAVTLGVLIVVHEYGHYLAARACGVKVLRFSVGFGNPIFSKRFKPGGTEWAIAAFPLGGYVKMLDEREGEVALADAPLAFNRQSVWRRMLIVAAGPMANFLLAAVIYWALFLHGMPGVRPVLDQAPAASPAAVAGLNSGDTIERIADYETRTWDEVNWSLLRHVVAGGQVELLVRDGRGNMHVRSLRVDRSEDGDLERDFLPRLGLVPAKFAQSRIGTMLPDSPAAKAGLRTGDMVTAVNGIPVSEWKSLVQEIRTRPGQALRLHIWREGRELEIVVTARAETVDGEIIGRIGAGAYAFTSVRHGAGAAVTEAVRKTWDTAVLSLEMLWKMLWGEVSWRNLSGPVTIADYAGQTAQMGWLPFLIFLALISTSLGVLNLLPVPVLDGGHLMYYMAEILMGRPVSERALMLGQRIGMALLFTLMLFALYNDINRLLGP